MGTIYERFGIEWNPEKEAYFRQFHAANPQHKYGTHTYSLAEVGVERGPLDERFARYTERYDVPKEDDVSDASTYETLLFDVREQVATVTLDRPDVRNAFGAGMGPELDDAFRRCDEDDDIRAVVLTGTPPAFCSGADLARGGDTFGKVDTTTFNAAGLRFPPWDVRKPVIGAINGHAIGVGMTLAIQCDLRFMAADAKYGVVQTQRGRDGRRVRALVAAAHRRDGQRGRDPAHRQDLRRSRDATARRRQPRARRPTRCSRRRGSTRARSPRPPRRCRWRSASGCCGRASISTATRSNHLETVLHHHLMGSPDAKEGVMAFLERRAPQWQGSVADDWPDEWPARGELA